MLPRRHGSIVLRGKEAKEEDSTANDSSCLFPALFDRRFTNGVVHYIVRKYVRQIPTYPAARGKPPIFMVLLLTRDAFQAPLDSMRYSFISFFLLSLPLPGGGRGNMLAVVYGDLCSFIYSPIFFLFLSVGPASAVP